MTVLEVAGVANFRDVGGIAVGTSRVRDGVLYRSGQLATATVEGSAFVRERVHHIVDLRDDAEVTAEPSAILDVPTTRVPLFVGSVASFFAEDMSLAGMYRHLVVDAAPRLMDAIRVIAAGESTLVHCTVGKDRTGVTVALALAAVGADRDQIVEDYALTAALLPEARTRMVVRYLQERHPHAQNLVDLATASPAPVMRELLAELDAEYGSVEGYLRAHGMTAQELDALGRRLVD